MPEVILEEIEGKIEQCIITNASNRKIDLAKEALVIVFDSGELIPVNNRLKTSKIFHPGESILLLAGEQSREVNRKIAFIIKMPRGFLLGDEPRIELISDYDSSIPLFEESDAVVNNKASTIHLEKEPEPPIKSESPKESDEKNVCPSCGEEFNVIGICINPSCAYTKG